MSNFLSYNDIGEILKSLSGTIKQEPILNSLNIWEKIWRDHDIKYNFFYDKLKRSLAFKIIDGQGNFIGQGFSMEYILHIGNLISQFYQVTGIQSTLVTFRHYPQFSSTSFELVCANHIQEDKDREIIEFSSEIIKNCVKKIPDFKYKHKLSGEIVFAECKSLPNFQRVQSSNIKKLYEAVLPELSKINKAKDLRIEISFSTLPKHWNKNLGEQLSIFANLLLEKKLLFCDKILNFVDIDCSITLHIRKKENRINSVGWIFIGDNKQNQLECNYFLSEASNTDNAFKRQIKDALESLPDAGEKHIFVELLPGMDVNSVVKLLEEMAIDSNTKISLYKESAIKNAESNSEPPVFIELIKKSHPYIVSHMIG